MKILNKLNNIILSKKILAYVILYSLFIIFHKGFEEVISNTIIKYAFIYVESAWYNDIIIISFIFIILLSTHDKIKKNYIQSNLILKYLISTTIIYIFYRFICDVWFFIPLSICNNIKYSDAIILLCFSNLYLYYKTKKEKAYNNSSFFFNDEPINEQIQDELGYNKYTELLASKIKSSEFDKSFAIGINGNWGIGKTSFINLIKKELNDNNNIEIDFKAWKNDSPKSIIKDFFETIEEKITPYNSTISRLLIAYSNKLISLNDTAISKNIHASITAITGFETLNSIYNNINNSLIKINKKIIVYIDDLDRLNTDEIVEVIRLIRNTANFYNTIFIVAYDRNYIINALKNHNSYKNEYFLEKIFQLEITLPYFKKDILRTKLANRIKQNISENYFEQINESITGDNSTLATLLNEWLENMRDVTRLANSLSLNLTKIQGEVYFDDFIRLELLRIKYPSVYELIYKKTGDFLIISPLSENKQRLTLIPDQDQVKYDYYLNRFLIENSSNLSIPKNEVGKIYRLIKDIFDGSKLYNPNSYSDLSVINQNKFYIYFTYNLLEGSLSNEEFKYARTLNSDKFNEKISYWVTQKLEIELKNKFYGIKTFENREDFEKIIKAIFFLAIQKSIFKRYPGDTIVDFEKKELFDKLNNYDNKIENKYYSEMESGHGLKEFIMNIFNNAKSPFIFEASFIKYINKEISIPPESSDFFPIKKDELEKIVIGYFKTYCSKVSSLNDNLWSLFHSCKQYTSIETSTNSYKRSEKMPYEAIKIMKEFVLNKDFNGFLLEMINPEITEKNKYSVSSFVLVIFENWETFKIELNLQSEEKWKYLKEFKTFYQMFENKNYNSLIEFNFNDIEIEKRRR